MMKNFADAPGRGPVLGKKIPLPAANEEFLPGSGRPEGRTEHSLGPLQDLAGRFLRRPEQDVMARPCHDPSGDIARTIPAQPPPHLPPGHKGVPEATQLIHRKARRPRPWPRIALPDESIPGIDRPPIGGIRTSSDKQLEFRKARRLRARGRNAAARTGPPPGQGGVGATGTPHNPGRGHGADVAQEIHPPRPGVTHKTAHQNQPRCRKARGRSRRRWGTAGSHRGGARRKLGEKLPGHLRGIRFAEDPARPGPDPRHLFEDGAGIVGQRPVGAAGVGDLDEAGAAAQCPSEGAEQRPIPMQPWQVKERDGLPIRVPMKPDLDLIAR